MLEMLHHMGSPVKPLLCVFSTIKLNCDVVEKLEQCPVQQTQQQTVPYCPTFGQTHSHTHTHTKRTRTHREHAVWHRYGRGGWLEIGVGEKSAAVNNCVQCISFG